ncbi:XRE family transcriptional regulator [Listeria monocytogenes]|nr:XRE family transcriptional regulator [Listeria monocytogenes]
MMIINRLAILLAERKLNITNLSKETGISRPTLTQIAKNETRMIQLETINTICIQLGINPAEFFVYLPYDYEFETAIHFTIFRASLENSILDLDSLDMDFYIQLDVNINFKDSYHNIKASGSLTNFNLSNPSIEVEIRIDGNCKQLWTDYVENIPIGFKDIFDKEFKDEFERSLYCSLQNELMGSFGYKAESELTAAYELAFDYHKKFVFV